MTNASLLARLRTMLDEASAAYWTDTEAYQALTDGQNALVAMAVSQYLQSMEKLVGTGKYAHLVEIPKEEIDVPYILQGLSSMQSGTVASGNSSASFSGTVLTLIWALYNPGGATPLYPIRLRSIAGVHPVNYTNPNPFLNEISTAVNGYASFTQLPPASGAVGQFTIGNAGTNYVAGDFVKLSGGGANAVFLVATIGAGGVITGLTLVQSGSGYSVGGPYSTTTNSVSGAGCTISITQLGNATLTFESVSSSNSAAWQAGVITQPVDITSVQNPTLPDICLSPIVEFAFAKMMIKDQRNDEANSAMQRYQMLAQSIIAGESTAVEFTEEE